MTPTPSGLRVSLARVFRGELIKLRGLRSTWWILGLGLTVPPLASLIWAANTVPATSSRFDQIDAVAGATTSSIFETLVLMVLFGSFVATNEMESRTITTSLAAVPRRWPVVIAKSVVVTVLAFVITIVSATTSFVLSSWVVATDSAVTLGDPGALRIVIGMSAFATAAAVIALSAALVIRSSLGAVAATFGFLYVLPGTINLIPLTPIQTISTTFPGPASNSLIALIDAPGDLPYGIAGISILGWVVVCVAIAIAVVRRRDV